MRIIFVSGGNDSVALIQWARENVGLMPVYVAYSDTRWADEFWIKRMAAIEKWVKDIGFCFFRIESIGFRDACLYNGGFPRSDMQFCTRQLKIEPAEKWMDEVDPEKNAICMIGVRREESARRKTFPEYTSESKAHGYRDLHAPLVRFSEKNRNDLIEKTPFSVLPHRSKECYPCIHARAQEIELLSPDAIQKVRILERDVTEKRGRVSTMFRPEKHGGAVGIDAVMEYRRKTQDMFGNMLGCDSGWCEG